MVLDVSVLLPTHSPHPGRLARTLEGLRNQSLPKDRWELLVVDNASPDADMFFRLDLSWQPRSTVVREPVLGLTHARLAGISAATGSILVFVDDDNVLAQDYLAETVAAFSVEARLGAIGGKSLPEWELPPADWVCEFNSGLALRDFGDMEQTTGPWDRTSYPIFAPVGAGMALRQEAAGYYVQALHAADRPPLTDRRGNELTSGGDNDIVLCLLGAGWKVGYRPRLRLTHLIPSWRTTLEYLARLNYASNRSWVQVLDRHGIRPWTPIASWTVLVRKLRAWWRYQAWRDKASYVRWRGACGQFEGRAALGTFKKTATTLTHAAWTP
jgi:glycosyltransferase involved in cell wall biosynthesis